MRYRILTVAAAASGLALLAPAAQAAAPALPTGVVASWQMNETQGSTVLVDTSGHGYNGGIGNELTLDGASHSFPVVPPGGMFVRDHQRLDIINHNALNPGTADWSVTVRLAWDSPLLGDINVAQKGQGKVAGGRWHMATPKGHIKCVYEDATGDGGEVDSWAQPRLTGTGWHIVTCAKVSGMLQLIIDGKTVDTGTKHLGPITNTTPMSIGGKLHCTCDYWTGKVDYVVVRSG